MYEMAQMSSRVSGAKISPDMTRSQSAPRGRATQPTCRLVQEEPPIEQTVASTVTPQGPMGSARLEDEGEYGWA